MTQLTYSWDYECRASSTGICTCRKEFNISRRHCSYPDLWKQPKLKREEEINPQFIQIWKHFLLLCNSWNTLNESYLVAQTATDNKPPKISSNLTVVFMHIQFHEKDVAFDQNFQHALEYEMCNRARNFSFSFWTKLNGLPLGLLMAYINTSNTLRKSILHKVQQFYIML